MFGMKGELEDGMGVVGKGTEVFTHVRRRKHELIACDAREDRAVFGAEVYVLDEEGVPFRCRGAEDGCVSKTCQHILLFAWCCRLVVVDSCWLV
jgi:hypothetical protein